ncbi:MAG: hypothetical protein HYX32_08020 [Actinobacteria bacterium]|nr:hypothetical protein [Actinomycetota bacterium]
MLDDDDVVADDGLVLLVTAAVDGTAVRSATGEEPASATGARCVVAAGVESAMD